LKEKIVKRKIAGLSVLLGGHIFLFSILIRPLFCAEVFTLEAVLSAPFPSGLVASSKGDLVAWVFNERGRRNIWIAKGPEYKARKLTAYSEDDGQDITGLAFNPDASMIVFVRGGPANGAGEYPNPRSDSGGVEQALWAVKISGGAPWRIGEANNPVPSPSGKDAVYLLKGQIYLADLAGPAKPHLLFKARGTCGQPAWSPDGLNIAFVSFRGDHSFIGIYDLARKSIRWIAPSLDQDVSPVFSPDGKNLAFFRFPGSMNAPSFSEGESFRLMIADVGSGEAREVWKCPDESGGFVQKYATLPLQWASEGRLLFYSEHEGWTHIYSLPSGGGTPVCLTPGNFDVEDCAVSPDRKTLVFNSNSGDPDRRHLWSVSASGGTPEILTPGKGIEWTPVWSSSGDAVGFLCSTATQPAVPAVLSLAKREKRLVAPELIPAGFPAKSLVEPEPVIFKAGDGLEIHGQIFLPEAAKPGERRPAVIFMHGGPIRQMLLGWHMRGYYHNAYAFNQYLANQGYIVLSVNYRSGIGYGRAFRTAPNQGPRGASEYQDIVAAAKYLQGRPEVNPQKIGLWGGSYGGYLTALGLARDSAIFAAGVDLHGVHDWSLDRRLPQGGDWNIQGDEVIRLAYDSSPVADVRFWSSPVLFVHGDDDRNVDFNQTVDLVQRLRKEGKAHVETIVFPDEVHSFLLHRRWIETYGAAADFFNRFLKK
jgi:dipeptidyl aminopeptidase/acylaminoacyl peptidase